MAKKLNPQEQTPLQLIVDLEEAKSQISDRILIGLKLRDKVIGSVTELENAQKEYKKWTEYNAELLRQIFSNQSMAEEYKAWVGVGFISMQEPTLGKDIADFRSDIDEKINRLESISDRLELIPIKGNHSIDRQTAIAKKRDQSKIFIVHGHDESARENVARFIEKLGLNPIILHEQANSGQTIIEKLETNADVGFAVVLLTPDDEGKKKGSEELQNRARQNVVLELGYFLGKLGRKNVCALHKGSVEIPSDYLGVLFVQLDKNGGWQLRLAKEMKAAGLYLDMNKAV